MFGAQVADPFEAKWLVQAKPFPPNLRQTPAVYPTAYTCSVPLHVLFCYLENVQKMRENC